MREIWRTTKVDESYEISNLGNARSKDHYGYSRHMLSKNRLFKGHQLKKMVNNSKVRYTFHGKKKYMAHVLVAQAFPEICGEWFEGCQVHHKDGNSLNNCVFNLLCLTKEEHVAIHKELGYHSKEHNYWYGKHLPKEMIHKQSKKKKKPIIQTDLEGNDVCYWFSVTDCEIETGMHRASINRVCLGKQHTAYGFKWRYAS